MAKKIQETPKPAADQFDKAAVPAVSAVVHTPYANAEAMGAREDAFAQSIRQDAVIRGQAYPFRCR